MELLNHETIHNYGIEGATFNGECVVKNGVIEKLSINIIEASRSTTVYLNDITVRQLQKELELLVKQVDASYIHPVEFENEDTTRPSVDPAGMVEWNPKHEGSYDGGR